MATIASLIDTVGNGIGALNKDLAWRDSIHKRVYAAVKADLYFPIFSHPNSKGAMDCADFVLRGQGGIVEIDHNRKMAEHHVQVLECEMAVRAVAA